jgi:hypothetical protein
MVLAPLVQDALPARQRRVIPATLAADGQRVAIERGIILGPQKYIAEATTNGGKSFVERVKRFGRTPTNEPLWLRRWILEILEALGDMRIGEIISTGSARTGKSVSNILNSVDMLVSGQLEFAEIYADMASRNSYAKSEWRPLAEAWIRAIEEEVKLPLRRIKDITTADTYMVNGVSAHFRYAGDGGGADGKASTGMQAGGYNANMLLLEEASRWKCSLRDFDSRLNAGKFPTEPRRLIGTPGAGDGIERVARNVDHYFMPHYKCANCERSLPLDPFGCLLQPKVQTINNKTVHGYLTRGNRPLDWWCKDDDNPVDTACICCSNCGVEIPFEARTHDAWMQCKHTGVTLRDYLDAIPPNDFSPRSIALHFSPLVRENHPELARLLISRGIDESRNAADFVQQDLGWPTEPTGDKLVIDQLIPLIGAPSPASHSPSKHGIIAGIDQGRGQHWLWVMEVHYPNQWRRLDTRQLLRHSIRNVVFAGEVNKLDIPRLLKDYGVTFGLVDNEPNRDWAARLCQNTAIEMADQKSDRLLDFERKEVRDGGESHDCWWIVADKFKQAVIDAATGIGDMAAFDGRQSYRFPADWQRYTQTNAENSPLRHLCAVGLDPIEGKWLRPPDKIDDLFFAAMFAEAAFAIWADTKGINDNVVDW